MYFTNFWLHMVTSLMEFVSWFLYNQGKNRWFAWWVNSFGWWGSVLGMILPFLFATF